MAVRSSAELGREAARRRKENELTQRELAEAVGMEQPALAKVEKGRRALTVSELAALAEVFGIEAQELLSKREDALVMLRANADDPAVETALDEINHHVEALLTARAFAG